MSMSWRPEAFGEKMLEWMTRDGKLVILSRVLRAFGYGNLSITIAIYLKLVGFTESEIGVLITSSILGGAALTLAANYIEARIGRKRSLVLFALVMSGASLVFVLSTNYVALLTAALLGTVNLGGGDVGAFLSLEQSIIPQTCRNERRNLAFALYNMGALFAGSGGALLVGFFPTLLQHSLGLSVGESLRSMLVIYAISSVLALLSYATLSTDVEIVQEERKLSGASLSPISRRRIGELCALFAVDSFGGGFFVPTLLTFWFFTRFQTPLVTLSLVFSVYNAIGAISFIASARLANTIGQLKTMVFTHIPGSALLIIMAVSPNFLTAVSLFLVSGMLSLMDVPARQSLVVSLVSPEERVAASGFTNLTRSLFQVPSPSISGFLLQYVSLSAPFIVGGTIEILYDTALFFRFNGVPLWQSTTIESSPGNI